MRAESTEVRAELTEDISILRNGNFKKLWGAQILSQIAGHLLNFALIISVFELAQGTRLANVSVALLILSFGIPSIFFAAAAGVYVDHWNKKKILVISNVVRGLLILGYIFFDQSLLMVLLLTFLISTATQFFTPAEAAAMPALVRKNQLLRANSLFVFTLYASFILGYSSSAPVIAVFGSDGPYIVTFIMFVISTILVALLPDIHVKEKAAVPFRRIVRYTGREIRSNWHLIRSSHNLSFPILQLTLTQAVLGVILALAPAMSLAILGLQLKDSSHFFIIPAGIGMIVGVLSIDWLTKRYSRTQIIAGGLLIASAALLLLGLVNRLHDATPGLARYQIGYFVAPLVFMLGYMNALVSVAAQTVLQENTTDSTRGKVFGALGMMINIAATLPVLFAGILADLFGVPGVIASLALGLLIFSIYQYFRLKKQNKLA